MTDTATHTITSFLLARIADTEAIARRVQAVGSCEPAYDPARVLAECEAKRRIVALHWDIEQVVEDETADEGLRIAPGGECAECHHKTHPCPTLRALTSVYTSHPDYNPDWA
jgi:hypothetical protein